MKVAFCFLLSINKCMCTSAESGLPYAGYSYGICPLGRFPSKLLMKTKIPARYPSRRVPRLLALGMAILAAASSSFGGPFILSGTDSDDHGSNSGTSGVGNSGGWLFMQKAITNLGSAVTNGNTTAYVLGSSSTALTAATSAFDGAGLAGWTLETVSVADFASFFDNTGAKKISSAGLLLMDSGSNVVGGVSGSSFDPYAAIINAFVGSGGGLFSQANDFSWVTSLVPTLSAVDLGGGGVSAVLSLTAAGTAAFPGLTDSDLSTGPYHNYFSDTAGLPILATDPSRSGRAVVLGGSGSGSITVRGVPDAGSFVVVYLGLIGAFAAFRRFMVRR
ncbi:MAG TPA: hypothetical protein PLV87_08930 [Opitutaceae bacterium]|nr:hypothetical protein [Opitutaceae bacterium]